MALEISTKKLAARRDVIIDGHQYTVRKFGNLEELNMSQMLRELQGYAAKEKALGKGKALDNADLEKVEALSRKMAQMYVGLFDDGGDQSKSQALVEQLSAAEIAELLAQVFAEPEAKADSGNTDTKAAN